MSIQRIFIIYLSIASPVLANDELIPISVSASRTSIPTEQVTGALTIIDQQEIERRNAIFVSDILQAVPGVNVSRSGGSGALTQVRLRGAEANQVLVIIDGVEVNDPATGSEFNFAHLPANNIERIEILRGPQSALWGSDALGGVINIVTSGATEGHQIIAKNSYGSDSTYESGVNFSYGNEKFDAAFGGNFIDTKGINIATAGSERDGYDNINLHFNTGLQLTDNIEVGMNTRYTNASNEFDSGFASPIDSTAETDVEQLYARAFLKASFFNDLWAHQLAGSLTDTSNATDDDVFASSSRTEGTKEKFSYQTTVHAPQPLFFFSQQSFTFLAEREQERFDQTGAAFPGFDPNQRQKITNYGYVLEYRTQLFDNLSINGAVRFDNNEDFDDQNTFRVGANYIFPTSNTRIYTSYATGAKNPTFTELFGFAPASFIGNPDLEAEHSESFEVGLSQALLNNRLRIDIALFWEDLIEEIQTVFLPTFESTTINSDGRSKRNGLELTVSHQVNDSLSLSGSFTYLDATQPDILGNNQTETRRPQNQWSGQLNYRFLSNRANLNISVDHVGDRRDDDFALFERVTLNDYTRVDLAVDYQLNNNIKLFAQIRNLLDEEYEEVFEFETEEFSGLAGIEVSL